MTSKPKAPTKTGERKRVRTSYLDRLVEEQLHFQAELLANVNDAIVASDETYNLTAWNPAAEKMYGWKAEEVLGRSGVSLLQTQFNGMDAEEIRAQIAETGRYVGEATQLCKDGTRIPVEVATIVLRNDAGEITGYVSVNRDITKRKQAEELLRESEQKFSILFEKSSHAMSLSSLPDGILVDVNEAFENAFGYSKQEAIGRTSLELGINPDPEARAQILAALAGHGSVRNQELALNTKSGEARIFSVNIDLVEIDGRKYVLNTTMDITGQKRAEARIAYQSYLLENINDAILATDLQFRVTSWNHAAEEMYGYAQNEVLGVRVQEIIRSEFDDEQHIVNPLRENGSYRAEILQYHRDGHSFWVDGGTFALKGPDGKPIGYVSINRDITARKQAEEQVRRQLKQLDALHQIDTAISSSFDLHPILEIVLKQVIAQLGVDASAVLLFDPQTQALEFAASRGFHSNALQHTRLKLGEGFASQAILERKTVHIPTLMETGGRLARALQEANENFVSYIGTPLIVKGEIKGILEIYKRSPLSIDTEWLDFLETLAKQAAIAIDNAQLFESLQGTNAWLEQRVLVRTAELNQLNVELERANLAKDEFLATMSHELRTPLTSILGLSEALLEERGGSLNEYQQRSLQIIEASGNHLLELINDILDLSKIEAGKFDFYPQPVSVEDVCRSCLAFVKAQAAKKSIKISYAIDVPSLKILADPRRLKQILVNLLTNAVKFTPENGRVDLQVKTDLERDRVQFSVIDNGIGIAKEDLGRLFKPFVQLDSRLNRQHQGTGLGLALVQKLADLHGGSIELQSEVGKGSRFTVNLAIHQDEVAKLEKQQPEIAPAQAAAPHKEEAASGSATLRAVILLAEDNLPNVLTIGEYLKNFGHQVVVAHDGMEAIEKAEEIHPDLILMDVQMPVLDGLAAISRLRQNPRFADTPIIALTAVAMGGDRERCLQAGATEYMSKPVSLKSLRQTIENLLQNRTED